MYFCHYPFAISEHQKPEICWSFEPLPRGLIQVMASQDILEKGRNFEEHHQLDPLSQAE